MATKARCLDRHAGRAVGLALLSLLMVSPTAAAASPWLADAQAPPFAASPSSRSHSLQGENVALNFGQPHPSTVLAPPLPEMPPSPPSAPSPVQLFLTQNALHEAPERYGDIIQPALDSVADKVTPLLRDQCKETAAGRGLIPLHEESPCLGSIRADCDALGVRIMNETLEPPQIDITAGGLRITIANLRSRVYLPFDEVRVGSRCPSRPCPCDGVNASAPGSCSASEISACGARQCPLEDLDGSCAEFSGCKHFSCLGQEGMSVIIGFTLVLDVRWLRNSDGNFSLARPVPTDEWRVANISSLHINGQPIELCRSHFSECRAVDMTEPCVRKLTLAKNELVNDCAFGIAMQGGELDVDALLPALERANDEMLAAFLEVDNVDLYTRLAEEQLEESLAEKLSETLNGWQCNTIVEPGSDELKNSTVSTCYQVSAITVAEQEHIVLSANVRVVARFSENADPIVFADPKMYQMPYEWATQPLHSPLFTLGGLRLSASLVNAVLRALIIARSSFLQITNTPISGFANVSIWDAPVQAEAKLTAQPQGPFDEFGPPQFRIHTIDEFDCILGPGDIMVRCGAGENLFGYRFADIDMGVFPDIDVTRSALVLRTTRLEIKEIELSMAGSELLQFLPKHSAPDATFVSSVEAEAWQGLNEWFQEHPLSLPDEVFKLLPNPKVHMVAWPEPGYVELTAQCACNYGAVPVWGESPDMCKFKCQDYSPSPPPPSPTPSLPPLPPTQWHYHFVTERLSWPAARDHCEDLGGRLALASSAVALRHMRAGAGVDVWVGANSLLRDGCWGSGSPETLLGGVPHLFGVYSILPMPLPTFGGKLTLMFWVRLVKPLFNAPIISGGDFQVVFNAEGKLQYCVTFSEFAHTSCLVVQRELEPDVWHHVVVIHSDEQDVEILTSRASRSRPPQIVATQTSFYTRMPLLQQAARPGVYAGGLARGGQLFQGNVADVMMFQGALTVDAATRARDGVELPRGSALLGWVAPTWSAGGHHHGGQCPPTSYCRSEQVFDLPNFKSDLEVDDPSGNPRSCQEVCEADPSCKGFHALITNPRVCYLIPHMRHPREMVPGRYVTFYRHCRVEPLGAGLDAPSSTAGQCGLVTLGGALDAEDCSSPHASACELKFPLPPSPPPSPHPPPRPVGSMASAGCFDTDFVCIGLTFLSENRTVLVFSAIIGLFVLVLCVAGYAAWQRHRAAEAEGQLWAFYFTKSSRERRLWQVWIRPCAFISMCIHTVVWGLQEQMTLDSNIPGLLDGSAVDAQLHGWSTVSVLVSAFCSAALLFDLLLFEGRRTVPALVIILQTVTFVLPVFVMQINVATDAGALSWVNGASVSHASTYLELAFEYVLLSRIATYYSRICLVFLLGMAPAVSIAGFLSVDTAPHTKFNVLRTRLLLLNCFFGGGLFLASILPLVFLFQAAPPPYHLPSWILYLWLILFFVQWLLQLALPLALASQRFRAAVICCLFLVALTLAGAANIDNRKPWSVFTNRTFWLLASTYISTATSMCALVFSALHSSWSVRTRKKTAPQKEETEEEKLDAIAARMELDGRWAVLGVVCFAISVVISAQDHARSPAAHAVFAGYEELGRRLDLELQWPLVTHGVSKMPLFLPTMDLFDGMLSFQLLCLALAGVCLGASAFFRVTDALAKASRIRQLDLAAGIILFIGVIAPLSVPYSWHSGVEKLCPRCGPSFDTHVQALAGDAVGLSAAGFFSSHMLYTLIHLPPSLFRPLHYLMLEKIHTAQQHDDLQTLRLVMRACSLLPPLFLGIPLAVLYHLIHFVHVDLGYSYSSLSRDHFYAFIQIVVFFFGPITLCAYEPNTASALWARYVGYIVLYYAPLVWRGLYESCTFESTSSWYYPMEWDGEIDTMFSAGSSWLVCFCFTWWPTTYEQWRGLVNAICSLIAEIVLVTVALKGLIHYVLDQQVEMQPNQACGPNVLFKLPPPRPMSPDPRSRLGMKLRMMNKVPQEPLPKKPAGSSPRERIGLTALALVVSLAVAAFGIWTLCTHQVGECALETWCNTYPTASSCVEHAFEETCKQAMWPRTASMAFFGVLPIASAVVGVLAVLLACRGTSSLATPLLTLWTILMCLNAMGAWVVYLLAEAFSSSICINDSFESLVQRGSIGDDFASSLLVDSSCETLVKQQYLEQTWAIFLAYGAAAVTVALVTKQLLASKKEYHVPPQL